LKTTRSEAGASKNAMKKLVTNEGVIAVIGCVGSNDDRRERIAAKEERFRS